jgi:quercetin dioxygenase-like cupin family protein
MSRAAQERSGKYGSIPVHPPFLRARHGLCSRVLAQVILNPGKGVIAMLTLHVPEKTSSAAQDRLAAELSNLSPEHIDQLPLPQEARGYHRETIRRTATVEVATARWRADGQSAWHGHDTSAAIYQVHAGEIEDERLIPEADSYRYEKVLLRAGEQSYLPPGSYHRVRALTDATTVHAYAPPPENATSAVPLAILNLLKQTRAQRSQRHQLRGLMEVVHELLPGWGARERQANNEASLQLPASRCHVITGVTAKGGPFPAYPNHQTSLWAQGNGSPSIS